MMNRAEKEEIVAGLKDDLAKSKAIFLTNIVGVQSNDANRVRKEVRGKSGKVVVTRNSLFERAAVGTPSEKLLKNLKGTNAVAFAFDDAAAVAKVLDEVGKDLALVELKGGMLGDLLLSGVQVKELAKLPSRDQMLATLLATFNAPASAFVRVLNAIHEKKEKGELVAS